MIAFWEFIRHSLQQQTAVILLYVVDSQGSSPGRQGFRMAIAADGKMRGTIGGGIMEHKWIERCRQMITSGETTVLFRKQYHDKAHAHDQSGMICSGEQSLAIIPLSAEDLHHIDHILQAAGQQGVWIGLSPQGLTVFENSLLPSPGRLLKMASHEKWNYRESIEQRPRIHIIGGGHVSLALSEIMAKLGFYVMVYDDRPALNTMERNTFSHEKHIVPYEQIGTIVPSNPADYGVIMTFGYRADKVVFQQLIRKKFHYLGMLGSKTKIQQLYVELESAGIDPATWAHVHAPIGINISSKTTMEIAISIAAEVIQYKNSIQSSS